MLDVVTYRASELIAKSSIPSWRISQVHNLDHFERVGFPVRVNSVRELGQLLDTMQENRFDSYMRELCGLTTVDLELFLTACQEIIAFQLVYLPGRRVIAPLSTMLSAFCLYSKIRGYNADFTKILEVGPGCGYLSFFLTHHRPLANYSQIEACESFYLLQNLVNIHCFGPRFRDHAIPSSAETPLRYFSQSRPGTEFSPVLENMSVNPISNHYPWWQIGELIAAGEKFDIVTSNANLLEFTVDALDDYLALFERVLDRKGILLVQCTGFPAHGTVDELLKKMHGRGFAAIMFVEAEMPATFAEAAGSRPGIVARLSGARPTEPRRFTTNNGVFVRPGHELFEKYHSRFDGSRRLVGGEECIRRMFFGSGEGREIYSMEAILKLIEESFARFGLSRRRASAA